MKRHSSFPSLLLLPWLSASLLGQVATGPLELRDDLARNNLSSLRGLPLSSTVNDPVGSDGRAPREGSQLPPLPAGAATVDQFSSAIAFGGGVRPRAFQPVYQGLVGEYWNWGSLPVQPSATPDGRVNPGGPLALRRLDPGINFDWGGGAPGPGVGADQFYVRWTGEILPKYSETYTLSTASDDGSWLWINDQLVVSNGGWHGTVEATGTYTFQKGKAYRIRIEMAEWGGGANCWLRWQSPSQAREIVPASALRPLAADLPGLHPTSLQTAPGFNGSRSLAGNAVALDLPRVGGDNPTLIQLRARIGRPMVSRGVNFYFGSVIPVPDVDENGKLLSERGLLGAEYWAPEPFSTNDHGGAAYYWSPNARTVFATKPGPVNLVWRRINGVADKPTVAAVQEAGLWYALFEQRVVVSGSLIKPSRAIYWTQGDFQSVGKPVQVPGNRVSDIKVVYNDQVPERVAREYQGGTPVSTNLLQETRTLWYDRPTSQILAYNAEGRVFVELLGDLNPDGTTRRFLGFEIVDVFQQATPQNILVDLGDRMPAFADLSRDDSALYPQPVEKVGDRFIELYAPSTGVPGKLFAIRETRNVNDALVYWMEPGIEGLLWPRVLSRYELHWPADVNRYSHYLRPEAGSQEEAKETAVQMDANSAPLLIYQDAPESPRAFLEADLKFYTFLNRDYPAHRTLLRYNGAKEMLFERVYSWLDANLVASNWAGTLVTNLTAWNPTNSTLTFPAELSAPRLVNQTVEVGARIASPAGEAGSGSGDGYLAGFIRSGTSYNPGAYRDPFASGFEAANRSSIIPVNAVPGKDTLEVWWFRRSATLLGAGLSPVSWPAVRALYTIQYPASPREIVLASNAGSGGLDSLEARGTIYQQNDPEALGYNPNEEHALMIGGQAYALRDDLNIVSGGNYSSLPFVLLDYFGADGRPSMAAFKVLREKPEAGMVFDYVVEAGTIVQAPMPLPLLPAPTEGEGVELVNYNREIVPGAGQGNLPVNWNEERDAQGAFGHYKSFTYHDRKESFWVYRGLHREPALQSGAYNPVTRVFGALPAAVAISGREFKYYIHASRRAEGLVLVNGEDPLPDWLRADSDAQGLVLRGIAPTAQTTNTLRFSVVDVTLGQTNTHSLTLMVRNNGSESALAPLVISNQTVDGRTVPYVGRPPYLAEKANDTNSFRMRYYYKTLPGFAWPNLPPVPEGSIVPYLRPAGSLANTFVGEPGSKLAASLDIVYRPAWPANAPVMQPGQTLTAAARGLPAIRGQSSVQLLYQQSIATNFNVKDASVVLIDPTRKKLSSLASAGLGALPSGILTEYSQGLVRFPNLPPHLASRVYFDPNEGAGGSLVLIGEFKDEPVGEKYLHLNVLRGTNPKDDLQAVLDLCPSQPANDRAKWETLVGGLAATVEVFRENPRIPGQFVAEPSLSRRVDVTSPVEIADDDSPVDSYALSASGPGYGMVSLVVGNGRAFTAPGEPVSVQVFRVGGKLWPGELKIVPSENPLNELLTFQHTPDLGGRFGEYEYEWRIGAPVDGAPPKIDGAMSQWFALQNGQALPRYTLGGAGVQVLSDNYVTMRYRSVRTNDPVIGQWSPWTEPQLAEGWIKRVLAGINPFQQRVKDLYNNAVNTDVSVVAQAGPRWEGAVGLNLNNINSAGLIAIYETVLRRGRDLSINAGINYGPANDALLLVAGYLNDLYSLLGDEAQADADNPTIATGVGSATDGSVATAKFSFAGQLPSLLEEELALLRGRDDFMQPGVQTAPAYNRLYWNFTRGINSGEVIYTENYNIKDLNNDGLIDAADAALAYPQGHGDAYGHYLTALKGYYSLLVSRNFDWVPRSEAVTILGKAIQVDYVDERKFASAAGTVAQTGLDIAKLEFRKDYQSADRTGWARFGETRLNTNRVVATERFWGLDHWVSRTGQGAYVNWIVGNSMLPDVDPDPTHEGIQKIDRGTVPELGQLPVIYRSLQQLQDNAEAGLTPLGLPRDSIALDIDPSAVVGTDSKGHFEQLYDRAVQTLENASFAFEEARAMSTALRGEGNDLEAEKAAILDSELSLTTRLIELYGTPYTDDIGPGKTYPQDYAGPDLIHYAYVELPETLWPAVTGKNLGTFTFSLPGNSAPWASNELTFYQQLNGIAGSPGSLADSIGVFPTLTNITIEVNLDGVVQRPAAWTGKRRSPGRLQQAYSDVVASRYRLANAADDVVGSLWHFQKAVSLFQANWETTEEITAKRRDLLIAKQVLQSVNLVNDLFEAYTDSLKETVNSLSLRISEALPKSLIAGLAAGGDLTSGGRAAILSVGTVTTEVLDKIKLARLTVVKALEFATTTAEQWSEMDYIAPREQVRELRQQLYDLATQLDNIHGLLWNITAQQRASLDADMALQAMLAEGDRIQAERLQFRNRAAAMIQGYRTRDVAFRLFRNEKLDRYKSLVELASQYSLLVANAYDYETGLLGTARGHAFVDRIIQARALGVVRDGRPQITGTAVGDPGLSGALAEMSADWSVVKGRLGFNNADGYSTTASLRTENFRILPGADGDSAWTDVLNRARRDDLLQDADIRRMCLQVGTGAELAVPGIVLEFSTTISDGFNLFGQPLAAKDHAYSGSSFATKVFSVGVALEGYQGMDGPAGNAGVIALAGGETPAGPDLSFMDPTALAATPYVYLIPVGVDSMRSPPLGDSGGVRTWAVQDVNVPMPFNIGQSDYSHQKLWQSSDSLSEPLFGLRKHQAFRPVATVDAFPNVIFEDSGGLARSQFTNSRLIGRSVWNSHWKLVIPGKTLLNNPAEGLDRFIRTVKDVKLHFVTYSYSGN